MNETDEEFPKPVDSLPDGGLDLSFLRSLQDNNSIREIYIPRFVCSEQIDSSHEDVWDTSIGLIPTSNIEKFMIVGNNKIVTFELGDEGWQVNEPTEKDDIPAQLFAEIIKPYVEIKRAIHEKEQEW